LSEQPGAATNSGEAWKDAALVRTYLEGVRAAIPLAAEQIELMLRLVDAAAPVRRFADLGCGDGVLSRALLDRYPHASAVLVDFSQPMMEAARNNLARPNVRFLEADLASPSWAQGMAGAGPFDAVVSGFAIHHLTDDRKRALYAELFDLLRPGGMFVNTEHVSSPSPWIEARFNELLIDSIHAHEQARGSGIAREEIARRYVNREDKHDNILTGVEEQCDWLRDLGYRDVDCYFKLFELAIFGGRRPAA
jgi:tRNA (cmo5U34)-methyltransferase